MNLSAQSDSFAFELIDGGGLLLDLASGQVLVLNKTAAFVWERHLAGEDVDRIAAAFAKAFGVESDTARADVTLALRTMGHRTEPRSGALLPGAPVYRRSTDGYRLILGETPLLEVSASGGAVRVLAPLPARELGAYLRVLSPKLAALRGMFVLHASAVRRRAGDVIAFSGPSGSGKTTTAHAFAQAGCDLLCEDKLVVRFENGHVMALARGESDMASFMGTLQPRLDACPTGQWLDIDQTFDDIAHGPASVLAEIMLIDASRRSGASMVLESPPMPQVSARLFENVFVGSEDAEEWRLGLAYAARTARMARIHLAKMPEGLNALRGAARDYTGMTAS